MHEQQPTEQRQAVDHEKLERTATADRWYEDNSQNGGHEPNHTRRKVPHDLYEGALHPYTQSLLSAAPVPDPTRRADRRRIVLAGEIPNPAAPPPGCSFHPRCVRASAVCSRDDPHKARFGDTRTLVACHHAGPLGETVGQVAAGGVR